MLTRIKNLAKNYIFITNWRSLKTTPKKHGIYYAPFCFPTPSFLIVNNETFANPTEIANQLNHHFVNLGKSLVTNLSGSNDNDYLTYLKPPCLLYIFI